MKSKGTLYIVGTPIGNLKDITIRALEILKSVDSIFAEDTRRTRKLLSFFNFSRPLFSYHDHSPEHISDFILEKVKRGESVAIVSDAGMPGFSDPGYTLIKKAIEQQIQVIAVPGPSAILTSILISGLPPYPFAFIGFPPSKGSKRKKFFQKYGTLEMTMVMFESPHRLIKTLHDIETYWGNRFVAIARELTKIHEEVIRGKISELLACIPEKIKGEITLIIEGYRPSENTEEKGAWIDELASTIENSEESLSKIAKDIAKKYNLSKKLVYSKALKLKEEPPSSEGIDNTP